MAFFQRTLTAAVAATALAGAFALPAFAQAPAVQPATTATAPAPHTGKHMGQRHTAPDFAKLHAERNERLKTLLQLQPNQQATWEQYVNATAPAPRTQQPGERPDLRKLTTPQRLDLAQQLRKERTAKAEQREQATRSFYSSLNASQQKAFDTLSQRTPGGKHHTGHGGKRFDHQRGSHHGHGPAGHPGHPAAPVTPAA